MTPRPLLDRVGPARDPAALTPSTATGANSSASRLAGMALALVLWRRRARQARGFRGFDKHQLRDLGLSPFDQW